MMNFVKSFFGTVGRVIGTVFRFALFAVCLWLTIFAILICTNVIPWLWLDVICWITFLGSFFIMWSGGIGKTSKEEKN